MNRMGIPVAARRSAGFQICLSVGKSSSLDNGDVPGRPESLRNSSTPPVALRGTAEYNLRGGCGTDRRGSTGASPYRCDFGSLGCRRINH